MPDDYEAQLAKFMYGIGQEESGGRYNTPPNRAGASGKYQFIDSTWGGYGGYQHAYQAPPEIQDERARQMMGAYYRKFGSWSAVAQAWLGGPGSVGKNVSDGNIGSFAYANNVLRLAGLSGSSPAPAGAAPQAPAQAQQMSYAAPQQTGPDYHNVDTQVQTILGLLSKPASNVPAQALEAQTQQMQQAPDVLPPPPVQPTVDQPYLQRAGRAI